ncbi:MAG: restriction endonuclease subunit S [Gammaproteobacteria bacterium]|nr:MAG: restriction endonuclease subunit S [Gammaproteobacteria bacterium]
MSNKAEESGLAPKWRFPEFREAGEWDALPLGQLAKRSTQKNNDGKLNRVLTNSAEFGVVDQRDFFDKDIANQSNLAGYFVVEKGDYVYNPRISTMAPVGPISKNNVATGVMSPLYTVFRFNDSHNDFYAYFFKTAGWHQYMRQASSTGARHDRMAISNDDFMAMPLPVASPEEQQKIADCLASLDELLTLEAQKLATLKTHKKGLMQQLFPAEGETLPKLRFPEFRDAGEWEENTLGNLVEIRSGNSPSQYELGEDGKYPFVKVEDLNNSEKYQVEAREYSNDTDGLVPRNSVIFPKRGAAIALNKVRLSKRDLLMDTNMMALTPNDAYRADFLFHYLSQIGLDRIADNSTIPQINNKHIIPFRALVPLPEEQQNIADCLASLDDLITSQTQKLVALKTHKKGLMQQLFPALDEVTA